MKRKLFWLALAATMALNLVLGTAVFYEWLEERPVRPPSHPEFGDAIPEGYYGHACPVPYLRLGGDVREWLDGLRWAWEYEEDVWDCSQQTAFLDWTLTCCGYETRINVGWRHAWLSVKIDGVWLDYESVYGAFVEAGRDRIAWEGRFSSLQAVFEFYEEETERSALFRRYLELEGITVQKFLLNEWAWWLSETEAEEQ